MTDEDRDQHEVRYWLDSVDAPASRLDVTQLVRAGRGRARRRRLLAAGSSAAVVAAAVAAVPAVVPAWQSLGGQQPAASAAPLPELDCQVAELPLAGLPEAAEAATREPDIRARAVDPTGRYVVGNGPSVRVVTSGLPGQRAAARKLREVLTTVDPSTVILWEDGSPRLLPIRRGHADATDVNADGVVVGQGWKDDMNYAWIYRDGEVAELPVPAGFTSADASAINARGDVVGTVSSSERWAVVIWPAEALDSPRVLTGPSGYGAVAVGISDDGTVVGQISPLREGGAEYVTGVSMWGPDGERQELPAPAEAIDVAPHAVHGHWVVGSAAIRTTGSPGATSSPGSPGVTSSPGSPGVTSSPGATSAPGEPSPGSVETMLPLRWDLRTLTVDVPDIAGGAAGGLIATDAAGEVMLPMDPDDKAGLVIRDGQAFTLPDPVTDGALTGLTAPEDWDVSAQSVSADGSVIVGSATIAEPPDGLVGAVHPVIWRC